MRLLAVLLLSALPVFGPVGCGNSKKGDNSDIQTPDDQPIGAPKPIGGKTTGGGAKLGDGKTRADGKKPPQVKLPD